MSLYAPPRVTSLLAVALAMFALLLFSMFMVSIPTLQGRIPFYDPYDELPLLTVMLAVVLVGAFLVGKRPGNPLGWLLMAAGLSFLIFPALIVTVTHIHSKNPAGGLGVQLVAWAGNWIWVPAHVSLVFTCLLFPNGQLASQRLQPFAWFAAAVFATLAFAAALYPGPLEVAPQFANPFGISFVAPIFGALIVVETICEIVAGVALGGRFFQSRGQERQQMKWVAFAIAVSAAFRVLYFLQDVPRWTEAVGPFLLLVAITIAVTKYRLYDIDIIINKTLVYALLSGILAIFYFGIVVGIQQFLYIMTGQESQFVVVVSTLAIAALFDPLRHRVQDFIDRRFYRKKYDAQQTLAAFSVSLRDSTSPDVEHLTEQLLQVIEDTVQPMHVSLWLPKDAPSTYSLFTQERQ